MCGWGENCTKLNKTDMPIFKVIETEKTMRVATYEIEAKTAEEAVDKYCDELAGSIEPISEYYRPTKHQEEDDVVVG